MGTGTPGRSCSSWGHPNVPSPSWGHPNVSCPIWGHQKVPPSGDPTWGHQEGPLHPGDTRISLLCPGDTRMSPVLPEDTWMSLLLETPGCSLDHLGTSRTSPFWSEDTRGRLVTPSPIPPINLRDTPSPRPVTGGGGHGRDMGTPGKGDTLTPLRGHQEEGCPQTFPVKGLRTVPKGAQLDVPKPWGTWWGHIRAISGAMLGMALWGDIEDIVMAMMGTCWGPALGTSHCHTGDVTGAVLGTSLRPPWLQHWGRSRDITRASAGAAIEDTLGTLRPPLGSALGTCWSQHWGHVGGIRGRGGDIEHCGWSCWGPTGDVVGRTLGDTGGTLGDNRGWGDIRGHRDIVGGHQRTLKTVSGHAGDMGGT